MKIGIFGNYMQLQLTFKNIFRDPKCKIYVCDQQIYEGTVRSNFEFNIDCLSKECVLRIEHWDKRPHDTIVENGVIVQDRSFELDKIIIDHYDLKELIWKSNFVAKSGEIYPSCLFFGPNGDFILEFYQPVLHWILSTKNEPGWEEDYNYYETACKLLAQI